MGDEKNELVDKIQAKLGRVLTSHEREILETENYLSASELGFPLAVHKLLGSWRTSFQKIASLYKPGRVISCYATKKFLEDGRFNEKYIATCIVGSILFLVGLAISQVWSTDPLGIKIGLGLVVTLVYGILGWEVLEVYKISCLFKQEKYLKQIICDLVDNRVEFIEIYARTPRPWREIFMGSPPKRLEDMAKLVAWNLDWYIKRPTFHFRLCWVAGIIIPTSMLVLFLIIKPSSNFAISSLIGIYACLIIHSLESWRKLTGLALLIEETKRIFYETERK